RESELEKMRGADPIIEEILRYRELQKLLSTYIDVLPQLAGNDGRIHPHFNQLGASTGRFSSQNPNIQNIPIKTERGRAIRHGFVSSQGSVLMSFDYAQIELRLAALLSQDTELLEIFNNNEDVHTSVAARVFHVEPKNVTSDMRRKAKVINFGILYGMGVNALKENLGTDRKEAQEFYDAYFAQFHQLATYLQAVIDSAKKTSYAQTLFGRRRYFPLMNSSMPQMRAMAERMAINAPVQGTCADIIKISMVSIDKVLKEKGLTKHASMLLQVHDELIFEVDEKYTDQIHDIVVSVMENCIPNEFTKGRKTVPIVVGTAIAKDWGSMK
ncbi:MAG: DNA polymerase, partial [Minisyncoccia bacterium]